MQDLNVSLFQAMAAGHSPNAALLWLATVIAEGGGVWLAVALVAWIAWRHPSQRAFLVATLFATGAASLLAHGLAQAIHMPRPFVVGLSPAYIAHGARGSMPSAHASVMFTLALVLCLRAPLRRAGLIVFVLAALTGWARVYVGVHFPFDVAGGLLLAVVVTAVFALLLWIVQRFVKPMIGRDDARGQTASRPPGA
jgi:undecaprenyl-diphosphatase